ncbi:hypothetical protein K3495_g5237 [Podosphaera aphanis]|nr:hypothetical protein K3495_g5237 [Podosphaera aphanis]
MAQPISMNNPNRNGDRRSRGGSVTGSYKQGNSLSGASMGSWIRDDFVMAGTSPFACQSPSFRSSSYIRVLEANFMKDFSCCGTTLDTLHELLEHYEKSHVAPKQQSLHNPRPQEISSATTAAPTTSNINTTVRGSSAIQAPAACRPLADHEQNTPLQPRPSCQPISPRRPNIGGIQLMRQQQQSQSKPSSPLLKHLKSGSDEMDTVEDMELDDPIESIEDPPENPTQAQPQTVQSARQSIFGQQPRLMINLSASGLSHAGLRSSQPSTPSSAGFGFQNNPTVSSVNTPMLSAHPSNSSQQISPSVSGPGTPSGETDHEFMNASHLNLYNVNQRFSNCDFPYSLGSDNLGVDYCIDEPAKRLYSPNGFNNHRIQQQFAQFNMGQAKHEALAQAHRAQQVLALTNNQATAMMMISEEHKPFRCPVIGCEKAYKNQNGLKYHKTHGHNSQQLHENGDGTFSIVNPETSAPYPGNMGMEKEKPYKCDACHKRYKNLNGLKYHKQHSPLCNPELVVAALPMGVNMPGISGIGTQW